MWKGPNDKSADKVEIEEKVSDKPSHVSIEELHEVLDNLPLRSNKYKYKNKYKIKYCKEKYVNKIDFILRIGE